MRHWKPGPMDVKSWQHWWDCTAAYQRMLEATDTDDSPWHRVQADDKRRARLNCIAHVLAQIPCGPVEWEMPKVGKWRKRRLGMPEKLSFKHEVPAIY